MTIDAVVWAARLTVAAVFVLAAWGKAADQRGTRQAVQDFGVPARLVPATAWALPAAELVVAVAVLPPASAVVACAAALALLAVFTVLIAAALRQGRRPGCSCFGAASTAPVSGWTLSRNAGIAILVAVALWGSLTRSGVPEQLTADRVVGLAVIVALAAVQVRLAAMARMLRQELAEVRAASARREGLPVGVAAPEFDLPSIDGTTGTLAGLVQAGHPVALVFLHPECGPCQDIAQELPEWGERLHGSLTLIPVGSGDLAANIEWARTRDLTRMLVQNDSEVTARYRLRGTPTAVLIDASGRIAARPARGPGEIRELLTHLASAQARP
jgi:uncharacterized membrane protein YphA (DoxX/SURF4 family)/thiol-disulfide isomerase/thioredoxin